MPSTTSPASEPPPIEEYWLALGQFVSEFSRLERQLQIYLMLEAGVDEKTAKAIFSGVRIDTAKSHIKRLRQVKGKPQSTYLERLFAQITVITNARNDILHYGADFDPKTGVGTVSNAILAMPGRESSFPVSNQILRDLCFDLRTIGSGLAFLMTEDMPSPPADFMESFKTGGEVPWRYKPPQPACTHQQRQTGA